MGDSSGELNPLLAAKKRMNLIILKAHKSIYLTNPHTYSGCK
jgi:hypothetical protein